MANPQSSGTNFGVGIYAKSSSGAPTDQNMRLYVNQASGNVGIGTFDPKFQLHLQPTSGGGNIVIDGATASVESIGLAKLDSQKYQLYLPASVNDLRFYDTADRVTFQSGGNVGIGSVNPGVTLDVVGSLRLTNLTSGNALCKCTSSPNEVGNCTSVVGSGGGCTCAYNGTTC